MQRHIDLTLRFHWRPSDLRSVFVLALSVFGAVDIGSESVTLTTYYPAPSGVYTNMITTNNTYLARDGGGVGVRTTTIGANSLAVNGASSLTGNLTVAGNSTFNGKAIVNGPLRIIATGCVPQDATQGSVCGGGQYATFTPGFNIEGWSYQNRGGQVQVESLAGQVSNQVRGLNPASGAEEWMTLKKDDSLARIYCCPS